ncbi:MAG TPA: glycosyltransferase [bacterium]|nr:glycosyltransferase [bacterium]
MTALIFFFTIAALLYCCFISALLTGLRRLETVNAEPLSGFVSVIVPARNEERHIESCLSALLNQTWPADKYEIIVVDDASDDSTAQIAAQIAAQDSRITILPLAADLRCISPKKRALAAGINRSRGEYLFFTDADCVTPPCWIETMMRYFTPQTGLVASWLLVQPEASLLSRLETLDSLSLTLVGAAGFGLGVPFLANGANLAYRRALYNELHGFTGIANTASGDDDLFLLQVRQSRAWRAAFAVDRHAAVVTGANTSLAGFLMQRLRWASKTAHYPLPMQALELGVYLFFVLLLISVPLALLLHNLMPALALPVKMSLDFLFMKSGAQRVNRRVNLGEFIAAEVLQAAYIVIIGPLGLRGRFSWKERGYVKGKPG